MRTARQRANATIFQHSYEVICDIIEQLFIAVSLLWKCIMAIVCSLALIATFPITVPLIAYMRRRSDRIACAKYDAKKYPDWLLSDS